MTKVLGENPMRTRSKAQRLARDLLQSLVPSFSPGGAVWFDEKSPPVSIISTESCGTLFSDNRCEIAAASIHDPKIARGLSGVSSKR